LKGAKYKNKIKYKIKIKKRRDLEIRGSAAFSSFGEEASKSECDVVCQGV